MKGIITIVVAGVAACVACTGAFLRRRPAGPQEPWSGSFTPADYRTFAGLVRAHFRAEGLEVTIRDGYVYVAGDEEGSPIDLSDLAQACQQHKREDWPALIAGHLQTVRQPGRGREEMAEGPGLAQVADLLAVHLWPEEYLAKIGRENVLCRDDLEDTASVLVYDLPSSTQHVRPQDAARWGKSIAELFELALANTHANNNPQARRASLGQGMNAIVFSGDSLFMASEALLLPKLAGCLGRYGTLVGVPHRQVLICYPIESQEVVKAITILAPAIHSMHEQGPGSISPNLYWYHDGRYSVLPYEIKDQRVSLYPPDEFAQVMNKLAGGGR